MPAVPLLVAALPFVAALLLFVAALLLFVRLQVPVLLFVAVLRQVPVEPVLVPSVLLVLVGFVPVVVVLPPALLFVAALQARLAVLPELLVVLPAPL